MSKYTLNGTQRKVLKISGFRSRLETKAGKNILKKRRRKGRFKFTT